MIQISLNNGRRAFHVCLFCGRKINPRRVEFHTERSTQPGHSRCYSTKIIRGYSNGDRCEVKYSNSTMRQVKEAIDGASTLNSSLAYYLLIALKRAATLNEGNVFYLKHNIQASTGSIHTLCSSGGNNEI